MAMTLKPKPNYPNGSVYDWGDKSKIEHTWAVGDSKNRILEVFRGLENMLA